MDPQPPLDRDRVALIDARPLPVYDFGAGHPFAADRLAGLYALLERSRLVDADELVVPEPATAEELALAHDRDYVDLLERLDDPSDRDARRRAPAHGLGIGDNPIRPGQHAGAAAVAGASLACVRQIVDGQVVAAFNPAGGLHHAMPDRASGFCLYNDLVIAIRAALAAGIDSVAYVDFDVHHGDGVEFAFRDDPRVLTVSFHEDPDVRWPGTGRITDRGVGAGLGTVIDMPIASGTTDPSWCATVERVLQPAFDRFRPQLLVTQHGCDPHYTDPLADLSLTTKSFGFAARLSRSLAARHCERRWLATGGGGYRPFHVLPRAWAAVWCELSGRALPTTVDPRWREAFRVRAGSTLPTLFEDPEIDDPRSEVAAATNARTLVRLLELHGLG